MKQLIPVIIFCLALTSCEKPEPEIDRNILLVQSSWFYSSVDGFNSFLNDLRHSIYYQEYYYFDKNGTYKWKGKDHGTWSLNEEKTVITLTPERVDPSIWTIVTLTKTELTVSIEDEKALNGTFTKTFTH